MSKTLRTAALVVGAVALVATGVGAIAGTALVTATIGVSAATLTAVAGGLSAASALTAKKPSASATGSPTDFTADPQAFIPYAIGRTGTSGNIVFRRGFDTADKGENDRQAFAVILSGCGPIAAVESFHVDRQLVTFGDGMAAVGPYAGYMWGSYQIGTAPSPFVMGFGDAVPPGWTAAHNLSGYAAATWQLRFDTKSKLYQNGVPTPLWVVLGVRVYDPRQDSSYPGGSGACRAGDEATYVYSENPYLHGLTWVLGRFQNGKRVMGLGAPVETVDVAAYVEGANVADANGWRVGGVVYSGDGKWVTLKKILQAGMGEPLALGARISCLVNAPKVSLATITVDDVVGEASVTATQPRRDRINTITPRYRLEENNWELLPGAPIAVAAHVAEDGGSRSREQDYPLIQHTDQVATAVRYDIENAREFGPIVLPLKTVWIGYKPGDCVTAILPELGLNGQPILLLNRDFDPSTGVPTITARSETLAKHAFALGQTTTPPPTPGVTGPLLVPVPADGAWAIVGTEVRVGETSSPAIVIAGGTDSPVAESVVFEYRVVIAGQGADAGWQGAGEEPPTVTAKAITGIRPGAAYEAAVSYRRRGSVGDRRVLGPVQVGDLALDFDYVTGTTRPEDHATDGAYVDPTREHGGLRGPDGQPLSVVQIVNTPYTLTPDGELLAALYGGGTESAGRIDLADANAAAGRAIERVRVLVDGVQADVLAAILAADLVRREQLDTEASVRRDLSERAIEGERATAAERTTITARIAGAEARVSDLRVTTATGLAATAAQILTVSASLAGATAQIEIQRAASVTRDEAIASSVTRVDAALGIASARIEDIATASASADQALAGSITSLDAELGTARGRIEQVSVASVDRDQALSGRIDTIDATYGGNSAAIEQRLTALASADEALAGRASSLEASTEQTNARIGREEVARAGAIDAVAGEIVTITTRVGASEATITSFAESIDGLRARRGVALDVNGYATGWTLDNDGQTGGFDVVADRFRIARPAPAVGPPQPPQPMFVIEAGIAKFAIPLVARSIDTDVLKVRGVLAENLDFGATGDLSIYYHAVDFDVNNGGGWTALSGLDIISREGSPMQGHFAFAAKHVGVMMGDIRLRVIRVADGTPVWGTAAGTLLRPTAGGLTVAGTFFDSVNAGTQVQYDVQMSVPSGSIVRCSMRTMTVEELVKRRFQSIQIYTRPGEGPGSGAAGGGQINGDATGTGGASGTGGGSGSGTGGGLRAAQQEL